jgi:hypothetical protein
MASDNNQTTENPEDFIDLTWDDDAGSRRVFPVLDKGKYGLNGEAQLVSFSVKRGTIKSGRSAGEEYRQASLRVEVTHPDLGVVNVYDGGAFGPYNTNFASKTSSLWPAFARALGIAGGMKPIDFQAQLPMKVIVDVVVNEYDGTEIDPETQQPVKVKRRNNVIAGLQRL